MTDGDALLAAILAEPEDDLPRLAYADWLDEQGGAANTARAEFIRAQVELARVPAVYVPWGGIRDPRSSDEALTEAHRCGLHARARAGLKAREKTLLAAHAAEWLAPLRAKGEAFQAVGTHGEYRRGFIEVVYMPASWFVLRAEALFRRVPARELRVVYITMLDQFREMLASPWFGRLEGLDVAEGGLGFDVATELAAAPAVAGLKTLRLRGCGITDVGAFRLADVDFGWEPREVDVTFNPLSQAGLNALRDRFGAAVRFGNGG